MTEPASKPIPPFLLSTPRTYLTFIDPDNPIHTAFLVKLFNEPLFAKYEGKSTLDTPAKAAAFIRARCVPQYHADHYGRCLMFLRPTHNTPVEECEPIGLISMVRGDDDKALTIPDVGFSVLEAYNGQGYATEGAKAMLDYVTGELQLPGVVAFVNERNAASARVAEKLGFENRGERKLLMFGPDKTGIVWASAGLGTDLSVYNLPD
ncbi:GNAT family acetyltransferase [Microthyrium microscopicum]|uniref:GNAT family acetyltransferase n=1 Tax=Microthyrium microscopicum TaxID=703497 RepID=A0A6A6UPP1_9PEZI|nr:GNAT family acetyltransferase [Microthyrium microscopicum]